MRLQGSTRGLNLACCKAELTEEYVCVCVCDVCFHAPLLKTMQKWVHFYEKVGSW